MDKSLLTLCMALAFSCGSVSYANAPDGAPRPVAPTGPTPFNPDAVVGVSASDRLDVVISAVEADGVRSTGARRLSSALPTLPEIFEADISHPADTGGDSETASASETTHLAGEIAGRMTAGLTARSLAKSELTKAVPSLVKAAAPKGAAAKGRESNCAFLGAAGSLEEGAGGGWWECTGGCLRSWGVSPVSITMCGVSCGVGAVPVCAACLGVHGGLLTLCSVGCGVYAD
jgi:hypothetical protein